MKKAIFAAVLFSVTQLAMASGGIVGGAVVVGGALHGYAGYAGYAAGEASSVSNGSAIAATSVAGNGSSIQ